MRSSSSASLALASSAGLAALAAAFALNHVPTGSSAGARELCEKLALSSPLAPASRMSTIAQPV
jgi:hypothetical protein